MYQNIHSTAATVDTAALAAMQATAQAQIGQPQGYAQAPASASLGDELRSEAAAALIALGTWIQPRSASEAVQATGRTRLQLRQAGAAK